MKKTNQNQGNAPLSKKQRKKQGARAAAAKLPMPKEKKWLIALIAAVCVMALVCATFGGILLARAIEAALKDPYASVYETVTMERYLDTAKMGKPFYTGNTFDYSGIEQAYAPKELAYMDEYIQQILIDHRTLKEGGQKQSVVELGDDVAIYLTDIYDEKGDRIPTSVMTLGSYTQSTVFTVGRAYFGADFDEKLLALKIKPEETGRETRQNGEITLDDTVCISYAIYKATGEAKDPASDSLLDKYNWSKTASTAAGQSVGRVTLSNSGDIEATLAKGIVDSFTAIGETYSFVLEDYQPTNNKTDKGAYKVEVNVHFVVEKEVTRDVTFTFPETFFNTDDGADLMALNGKQVTFSIILVGSDDYELPTFNREFITETLKMEITATDDAGAVAEYKEKQLAIINEQRAEDLYRDKLRQTYLNLAEKAQNLKYFVSTEFGSSLSSSVRQSAFRDLQNRFISTYGYTPSEAELNSFAAIYAYALTGNNTIQTYAEYLELVVQSEVTQELVMYYVFRNAGLEVTDEELNAKYEERLTELVERTDDPETYNRDYFISYYGGEIALKKQLRRDLVFYKVGAYLLENNTAKKGS